VKTPYLVPPGGAPPEADAFTAAISPIEEIIEDARNGRAYILVDAEDRENEGDVIIPAQFATPEQINFMAKHARGLVCLSITAERARQLRLPPMASDNQSGHTIAVAVDPTKGPDDIVSPGHVFPLVAKDGGVLVRAGHTEAAVDISRMAGLNPAGVICEVMKDDGSMARLPDLVAFAQLHGLKIGTIADLIAHRRRTERQVERVLEIPFDSTYGGRFRMVIYRNSIDQTEHVVLTKGRIEADKATLVRMHRVDLATDMLGAIEARREYVPKALKALADYDGAAVAVFIRDSNPHWLSERYGQQQANHSENILRDYGIGAQILLDLGVRDMLLLTSSKTVLPGSAGYGLKIVGRVPLG
jgi:3,4-dihydroxy 2-butanone 4-phosphate synthase/GTP cyclohydrolase II